MNSGAFVVSLDFELYWGLRDNHPVDHYEERLQGVWQAIPAMLELFTEYEINATWAIVGMLMQNSRQDILDNLPTNEPQYYRREFSAYDYVRTSENIDSHHAVHFAPQLVDLIAATKGQEIACHTYSHYYCDEAGQNIQAFACDLDLFLDLCQQRGIKVSSIIFPRNQVREEYLAVCRDKGIGVYRGLQSSWAHEVQRKGEKGFFTKAARLLDNYLPVLGDHSFEIPVSVSGMLNIPSSRFLRPAPGPLPGMEGLRAKRIRDEMSSAARRGRGYHLWWHPHNFGLDTAGNIRFLRGILEHFCVLRESDNFQSLGMGQFLNDELNRR